MNETLSNALLVLFVVGEAFLHQCVTVLRYPFNPGQRVFVVWLFTSLLFALFVFVHAAPSTRTRNTSTLSAFFRFLFPRKVWSHASTSQAYFLRVDTSSIIRLASAGRPSRRAPLGPLVPRRRSGLSGHAASHTAYLPDNPLRLLAFPGIG